MKTAKILLAGILLLGFNQGAEAQFLNRLKERVVNEAERVVINKTADKAAEKTGEAMDKILSPDLGIANILGEVGNPVDVSQLPEVYRFDYLYSVKMGTREGEFQLDYLLNKNEPYLGMKPNVGANVTMVIDEKNKAFVTMADGQVFAMSMPEDAAGVAADEADTAADIIKDYTITELPKRVFLGYECIGYRMENDEHTMTVYIAPGMEAGFGNVFNTKQANIPARMKAMAQHYEDGLMMYMEMEDKKNKGDGSATMECVAFEKTTTEIRTR